MVIFWRADRASDLKVLGAFFKYIKGILNEENRCPIGDLTGGDLIGSRKNRDHREE